MNPSGDTAGRNSAFAQFSRAPGTGPPFLQAQPVELFTGSDPMISMQFQAPIYVFCQPGNYTVNKSFNGNPPNFGAGAGRPHGNANKRSCSEAFPRPPPTPAQFGAPAQFGTVAQYGGPPNGFKSTFGGDMAPSP